MRLEQVEVLRWLSWNDCHWSPAVGPFYFEHVVKSTFDLGPPDRESLKSNVPNLLKFAGVLDQHLGGRTYAACERLTIADFQLASMANYWREAEMPFESHTEHRALARWPEANSRLGASLARAERGPGSRGGLIARRPDRAAARSRGGLIARRADRPAG